MDNFGGKGAIKTLQPLGLMLKEVRMNPYDRGINSVTQFLLNMP
jgi:hypothetical protein